MRPNPEPNGIEPTGRRSDGPVAVLRWPKLILASASPRRADLLRQVEADFVVRIPSIDEGNGHRGDPAKIAVRLAEEKAIAIKRSIGGKLGGRTILAADTVVSYRRHILGKPGTRAEAASMLRLLSGRTNQVITGLCLIGPGGKVISGHETTSVKFRRLPPGMIRWYVSSLEPMDKAGAYGIQGKGVLLVERIDGCYSNVVGLPLVKLDEMLSRMTRSTW